VSDLIIAGRTPDNVKLPLGMQAVEYGSDLYEISSRITEIHRSLFVVALDPPQPRHNGELAHWAVMQYVDGEEHLLFKAEALDGRVLERAAEIVHVPLAHRLKLIEAQEAKEEEERLANEMETAYETWGGQMRHELFKTGFTDVNPNGGRLLNRTARRHGRRA